MKFQFTEKKVSLPESVHAYAEKKVMKLERFFRDDAEALVTFSVEKDRNKAEITVHAAGTYFRASEATSDMYAQGDDGADCEHRRVHPRGNQPDVTSFAPEPEENTFEIVRTKRFPMKPMTHEEAILQMELLEHSFFAFKDEENDGAFAVVYKRNDGGYGLIEDVQ